LSVTEDSPVFQVPPITFKGNEGEALFHHAGFPEVCSSCRDTIIKALEGAWKKVRGRKKKDKGTGAGTPGAGVKPDDAFEEGDEDEDEEEDLD
jgi:hypothetical protein